MAKQHKMTTVSLWISGKQITISNQMVRLRYNLEYTAKEFDGAVSTDFVNTFDIEMPLSKMIDLSKNSITIAWQKVLRGMKWEDALKWNREVITTANVFPGKREAKPMTKEQILQKLSAGASNDELDELIAELEAMKASEEE